MNEPLLLTLGTPFGRWPETAAALLGELDRLYWTVVQAPQACPEAKNLLVWIEHPVNALANWLTENDEGDPAHAISVLESAGRHIVHLVHRHHSRCLVVCADEARANPEAFARVLQQRLNVEVRPTTPSSQPPVNPLRRVLAEQLVAVHPRLRRLHDELHASCMPLAEGVDESAATDPSQALAAVHAIQALTRAARSGDALQPKLRELQQEITQLRDEHRALRTQHDATLQEQQRAHAEVDRRSQENDSLLVQLHHAQEELEATFVKQHRERQESQAEFDKLQAAHRSALNERDASAKGRDAAVKERDAALKDRDAAAKERDALRAAVARHEQENELMLVQLHQVGEELEHYYLAYRDLDELVTAGPRASDIKVSRIEVCGERNTPPHRELSLVLWGVKGDDRHLERVDARLVEHNGHPGVAFFASDSRTQALMAWEPSGTEGGREYVLLVPADDPSRQKLQRLGTADWRFTSALISRIAAAVSDAKCAASPRWRSVAQRLVQQLGDLPVRLRYDGADAAPDTHVAGALQLTYRNASFGEKHLPNLRLRWWPQGDGTRIECIAPEASEEMPLLGSWPVEDSGSLATSWAVPLSGAPRADLLRRWHSLSANDRSVVLAVLDALPAAARRAADKGAVDAEQATSLIASASRPLRAAHRLLHGSRLRRVVRGLRGRIQA